MRCPIVADAVVVCLLGELPMQQPVVSNALCNVCCFKLSNNPTRKASASAGYPFETVTLTTIALW